MFRTIICVIGLVILLPVNASAEQSSTPTSTVLVQGTASWDGIAYGQYPKGTPQLTVTRIVIPANTSLRWHRHPMPSAAYVVKGSLQVIKQATGERQSFSTGDAVLEVMDTTHQGVTGAEAVELIVFYAGTAGLPLFQ
ncbi:MULTISPECIES: cupin domain-containing protein [unclassified Pseudomonas]|uniref:cupin domain-containing protein n=1 Tax=unclassified Pseudomonas TaxID=196821 RepID=UPI000FA3AB5F|nr:MULTISPECIES: cupin domain-containing protein [unclassified Pseudomonas]